MEPLPEQTETARLVLRRWRGEDAEQLHAAVVASIDHLRPWMAWIDHEPLTIADRRGNIERWDREWSDGGDAIFGVFLGESAIGGCGLHRRVGPDALEIGYWIHVDHARQGYATELTRGLTDTAFTVEGIERVEIHHDKANDFSGRVPKRLGYNMTAEVEDEILAPAETGVSWIWQTTRTEWSALAVGD